MGRIIVVLAVVLALPSVTGAATYYTDKAGSNANSCATAATAESDRTKAKLTIGGSAASGGGSCLTTAGDTLIVGDGTYVEDEIALTVSGTQANPITIRAENNLGVVLSSISSCDPNISFYASWLVVDGIHSQIDATDVSCPGGLNSATDAFVRMWNSTTPHIGGPATSGYVGGVVRNCVVDASSHRGVGIKSNQDSSLVEYCVVHQSLEGMNGLDQVFRENTIDAPDIYGDYFTCKAGSRNCQFYNNTITKNTGDRALTLGGNSGNAFVWDTATGYECYNCVAYNNVVRVIGGSTDWVFGMAGCSTCTMSNNVLIGGSVNFGTGGSAPDVQPNALNPTLYNNIFSCGGVTAQNGSYDGTLTRDYNNYYNCTGTPTQTHAISGDPLFVNASSDWHLQSGSPGLEAGTTVTAVKYDSSNLDVSLDRDGYVRRAQWDLGIYEDDRGGGEPIMFISFAWLLFGIAVVAGGALVVNGVQIIAGKVPSMWYAVRQGTSTWIQRRALRMAWFSLMRVHEREIRDGQSKTESVDSVGKKRRG